MNRTTTRRTRIALGAASLAAAALALTACGSSNGTGSTPSDATPAAAAKDTAAKKPAKKANSAADDVTITKAGFANDELYGPNSYVVHYKITNSTDSAKDYQVGLRFLDKDGDQLGSTGVGAETLGAGKSKVGKTAPMDVEIDNGKISDIKTVEVGRSSWETYRTAPANS